MKTLITFIIISLVFTANAQTVSGQLSLNGKSEITLKLETNSVVQLFKDFKKGKYKLKLSFDGEDLPINIYKEKIVFFEFITTIKKEGKLVKNIIRKQPMLLFPGEYIPVEAFDFIGALAITSWDDMEKKPDFLGVMSEGKYQIQLSIKPIDIKGEIEPVSFNFVLRKRPGRTKI